MARAALSSAAVPRQRPYVVAPRSSLVGAGIFVVLLVVFLSATRLPATLQKFRTAGTGESGRGRTTFGQVLDPGTYDAQLRWLAYGANLWDANAVGMFFAMLLGGAAVGALAPTARLQAMLQRRGARGAGAGGLLGVPLFLCSACSSPVSVGFYRSGATAETTLGMILGSALFNPVGILAIALLLPLDMALARVAFGLVAILALAPLAARWARPRRTPALAEDATCTVARETWGEALRRGLGAWLANSAEVALRLGPAMLLATVAVGGILTFVTPQQLSDRFGTGLLAVVITAAVGTLLQLPTLFEIPLVLGVLALGLGEGPAAALLVTAPSAGLVTLAITRLDLGWRPAAVLLAGTFVGGVAAGLLVGVS